MGTLRVVLVRHGESDWNARGILQGHGDPALTALGREQAESVAKPMADDAAEIVAFVRSDLTRVAQTAAPTAALLDVRPVLDERLREIDVGAWCGSTWEQVAERDPEGFAGWRRGEDFVPAGGETYPQLRLRVWSALQDLTEPFDSGTVAVFTHGGPIRVAVAAALAVPEGRERSVAGSDNGALTVLERRDGTWTLVAYNRTNHLPGRMAHPAESVP